MTKKAIAFPFVLASMAMSFSAAAAKPASPSPRLDGVFKVEGSVIRSDPSFSIHAGQTLHRSWEFFAKCPEGACVQTILKRTAPHGHRFMFLTKSGDRTYSGITSFVTHANNGPCHFRYHDEVTLRVTSTRLVEDEERAAAIKARFVERFTSSDCTLKPREQRAVAIFVGRLQ